jgi:hypothetical protein
MDDPAESLAFTPAVSASTISKARRRTARALVAKQWVEMVEEAARRSADGSAFGKLAESLNPPIGGFSASMFHE